MSPLRSAKKARHSTPGAFRAAVVLLTFAVLSLASFPQDGGNASAVSGADCSARTGSFTVPEGFQAARFRVEYAIPGKPCSGGGSPFGGFSIRRGGRTVFLYTVDEAGRAVSDPVPLEALRLEAGMYTLHAAPAAGAAVRIRYSLVKSE